MRSFDELPPAVQELLEGMLEIVLDYYQGPPRAPLQRPECSPRD